jgi:hypothetical protein
VKTCPPKKIINMIATSTSISQNQSRNQSMIIVRRNKSVRRNVTARINARNATNVNANANAKKSARKKSARIKSARIKSARIKNVRKKNAQIVKNAIAIAKRKNVNQESQ